jgi:hypothetical protein
LESVKIAQLEHGGDRGNQHTGGKSSIELLATIKEAANWRLERRSGKASERTWHLLQICRRLIG